MRTEWQEVLWNTRLLGFIKDMYNDNVKIEAQWKPLNPALHHELKTAIMADQEDYSVSVTIGGDKFFVTDLDDDIIYLRRDHSSGFDDKE